MRRHERFECRAAHNLAQVPLFTAFSPRQLKGLTTLGTYVHVDAGRELITAGDRAAGTRDRDDGHGLVPYRGSGGRHLRAG